MKLLIFYVNKFSYETNHKGLDSVEDLDIRETIEDAIIGFIHVEKKDEENKKYAETKLVKHLKWAARKNETKIIVPHSFNHLSASNGRPEFTKTLFDCVEQRLNGANYLTSQTPFGYFLNLDMKAPGKPLARIYKEF